MTQFKPRLVSGSEIMWLELDKLLIFIKLYLGQVYILHYIEPANKLAGLG